MLNSDALRRSVAVALVVAALVVLPSAPALAAGDGSDGGQAASENGDVGVIQEAIEWLVNLVLGNEEGDLRAQLDPTGHR